MLSTQRPGNMQAMQWNELDLDGRVWTILAVKMKRTVYGKLNGRPHLVPLPPQAVALLRELFPLTGHSPYVFPSLVSAQRPMSENTLRVALRRMGYSNDDMTPHGFRAMARTIMVEKLNMHPGFHEAVPNRVQAPDSRELFGRRRRSEAAGAAVVSA